MSNFTHVIHAFNGGELSPHMDGRSDIAKHDRAATVIRNFLIQAEGGLLRRSGARFVKPVAQESLKTRVIPFVYSTEQAYILEFSNNKIRFYKDEGAVLESSVGISSINKAFPGVVNTSAPHGYSSGDEVYIDTGGDMVEVNGRFFTITVTGASAFSLDGEDTQGYTTYTSGGTVARVYELDTTYTTEQVQEIQWTQSADVVYISHNDHEPAILSRMSDTDWTLDDAPFQDGPYLSMNTDDGDADPASAGLGVIAVDFNRIESVNEGDGFTSEDVGRMFRHRSGEVTGWGTIDAINSTTNVDVDFQRKVSANNQQQFWLGAWWGGDWPSAVSFAEGRLWWGGERRRPQSIYGSQSANFNNFSPEDYSSQTVTDASSIAYVIGSNQVNNVLWMTVGRTLVVGTPGAVFPVQASSNNEPVTPTNINVPVGTPIGAAPIRPVNVSNYIVYVDRTKTRLRGFRYSIQDDSYIADDLTRIADHVGEVAMEAIDYQLTPDSIVWVVREDGSMYALTFVPEEDVFAWSRHQIGGSFGSGDAVVESVAVIPAPDGGSDQVWLVVKRTIDGSTRRYVEFLEDQWECSCAIEDAFFVDCGLTYDGSQTTSIIGLNHLEGETVQVLADGMTQTDKVVTDGAITLDSAASKVHVGFQYNSDLQTLRIAPTVGRQGGGAGASTDGLKKRINTIILRVQDTNSGQYGRSEDDLFTINFRQQNDDLDEPTPLRSGDYDLDPELGWDREARLFFRQGKPLPFNLISMTLQGQVGDS